MIVKQLNDSEKKNSGKKEKKKGTSFQLKAGNLIAVFMDKKYIQQKMPNLKYKHPFDIVIIQK